MRAVIFDIDDTLYPYDVCDEKGMNELYAAFLEYKEMSRSEFDLLVSQAKKAVKLRTENTAASHNRMLYVQAMCELRGIFSPEKCIRLYNSYWDAFLDNMRLHDGAIELLEKLKTMGVAIGFCTDLTVHIQMRKLVKLGISHIPNALVTSEECGCEKPDKSMFMTMLEKLHASPSEAVMIGDSIEKDMEGAANCGIYPVLFGKKSDKYGYAENFEALYKILEGICR